VAKQTTVDKPRTGKAALPWISLVARVVIGGAILVAGCMKIGGVIMHGANSEAVAAVKAYQIPLPVGLMTAIGILLPIIEIILGALIIAGLFTRWTVLLGALMMLAYIGLIASVWARGLNIDCGCFTKGGILMPDQKTRYLQDILRDIALLACGVFVFIFPKCDISVDKWIAGSDEEES